MSLIVEKVKQFFLENWQRKLVALITAIVTWFLINDSITMTKTINNIPVKIINIPTNKTIAGMMPSGFLHQKLTITITGNKTAIQLLDSNNLQVIINAENKGDQWVAKVNKESLFTTNPEVDIQRNISEISQNEFVLRLTEQVTEKIPIIINRPIGESPYGYEFLDIWPKHLHQTLSGPKEQIDELMKSGIELTFDLDLITTEMLDKLHALDPSLEEVSFLVPDSWKKITLNLLDSSQETINDPLAEHLRIDFLKTSFLPLDHEIPIALYYPISNSQEINPKTVHLKENSIVEIIHDIPTLKIPLFAKGVSKPFLDTVKNHLEISVFVTQKSEDEPLNWNVQFIDPKYLENLFISQNSEEKSKNSMLHIEHEQELFRLFMRQFELFTTQDKKLNLYPVIEDNQLIIKDASN